MARGKAAVSRRSGRGAQARKAVTLTRKRDPAGWAELSEEDFRALELGRRISAQLAAEQQATARGQTDSGGPGSLAEARAVAATHSQQAGAKLKGFTEPRLFTPPLRPLTRATTRGYEVIDFARNVLGEPLLPWQEWLVIHALELLPDGSYRFRTVLALVARQNGKTSLSRTLALWRLYVDGARLVLGAAQDVSIAREVLNAAYDMAGAVPELADEIEAFRKTNGDEYLKLFGGARYKITAATRSAGRGLTVDHLTLDEIREHRDWGAWSALSKTTTARALGQIWALSNAGDDASIVLNHLRSAAGVRQDAGGVSYMGDALDDSIGIFEWSAPEGCALDDVTGWQQANPSLGYTISEVSIRSSLGTDPPDVFRTEVLCQKVDQLNGAFDLDAWKSCGDPTGTMAELRDDVRLCLDASPDGEHWALYAAAAAPNGRYRVEPIQAWSSSAACADGLAEMVELVGPRALAWFPDGPAAAIGPVIRGLGEERENPKGRRPLPPLVEHVVEITGRAVAESNMAMVELVNSRRLIHPNDPLLNAHVANSTKYPAGDGWRFARRGAIGHVNGAYAAAGALHTVRMPLEEVRPAKPMIV